jgi:hypothetical protein
MPCLPPSVLQSSEFSKLSPESTRQKSLTNRTPVFLPPYSLPCDIFGAPVDCNHYHVSDVCTKNNRHDLGSFQWHGDSLQMTSSQASSVIDTSANLRIRSVIEQALCLAPLLSLVEPSFGLSTKRQQNQSDKITPEQRQYSSQEFSGTTGSISDYIRNIQYKGSK